MSKNNIISLENPDVLTGLLRPGAKELTAKAVQGELAELTESLKDRGFRSPKLAMGWP